MYYLSISEIHGFCVSLVDACEIGLDFSDQILLSAGLAFITTEFFAIMLILQIICSSRFEVEIILVSLKKI